MKRPPIKGRGKSPPGEVRIIGGTWRGRRLPVIDAHGLRPTADRVRETLFNWLAPVISGTRGLDLFAGTGALGLEESLQRLACDTARVVVADARRFLAGPPRPFDVVFLDPPFDEAELGDLCTLLGKGWLAGGGRVYLEMPRNRDLPALPPGWEVLREKTAGQVRYALVSAPPAPAAANGQ
jgi:16S rRNA (guanine966-N2)-methyltransferase